VAGVEVTLGSAASKGALLPKDKNIPLNRNAVLNLLVHKPSCGPEEKCRHIGRPVREPASLLPKTLSRSSASLDLRRAKERKKENPRESVNVTRILCRPAKGRRRRLIQAGIQPVKERRRWRRFEPAQPSWVGLWCLDGFCGFICAAINSSSHCRRLEEVLSSLQHCLYRFTSLLGDPT